MRRYFALWLQFLRTSLLADMEFRLNLSIRVAGEFAWYIAQLSIFEVLYLHTRAIYGWTVDDMRVFMGCLFLADVLSMVLVNENLDHFGSVIRNGDLDLYLTKPVHSQFMVSFRRVGTVYLVNLLLILIYLGWALHHLPRPLSLGQLSGFGFLLLSGWITFYSLRFMFATLNVFLHDAGNLQFLWHQVWRLGTRPDTFYPFYLRIFILTAFPIAFFSSVPARVLVEGINWHYLLASPLLAVVSLFLSNRFWQKALQFYSSASS